MLEIDVGVVCQFHHNQEHDREYVGEAQANRRSLARILSCSTINTVRVLRAKHGHGLCYQVAHTLHGDLAFAEPDELKVIPTIGLPVTMSIGGDSYPSKIVVIQGAPPFPRFVSIEFGGEEKVFSLRDDGKYWESGKSVGQGASLFLGTAAEKRDQDR